MQLLQKRTSSLSLIAYEDTKQLDRMEQAKKGMELAALSLLVVLLFIGFYPWSLFMLLYLASLSPYLALILPLAFLPTLPVQFLRTRTASELEKKQAPLRRENDYYKKCITGREYFKETRSLGAFGYFIAKHQQTLSELVCLERKAERRIALREAEIYKMFADIAKGKTVIIVTHRLSSVQFADRIVVLQSGSIAETGTHRELLKRNGVYANKNLSAHFYRRE